MNPRKSMRRSALETGLALTATLASTQALADDYYLHHWENRHEESKMLSLTPEGSYYKSSKNYPLTGSAFTPTGLDSYSRMQVDLLGRYGIDPQWTAYARMSWARVALDQTAVQTTAYGFADQALGINYRAISGSKTQRSTHAPPVNRALETLESLSGESPQEQFSEDTGPSIWNGFALDLQAEMSLPTYSNARAASDRTPYLGDSSKDYSIGAFGTLPISHSGSETWSIVAGGAYRFRSDDFSSALPWSASLKYDVHHEGVFFSASALGYQSLKTDPLGKAGSSSRGGIGAGGSYAVNAINPSLITGRATLGYQMESGDQIYLAAATPFYGQNAAQGLTLVVGAQFRWDRSERKDFRASSNPPRTSAKGFVAYGQPEARVVKVSDRLHMIKIDQGSSNGVRSGQYFDIFSKKEVIARARVTELRDNEALLAITEYLKEVWIEEGFIARPLLR